MKVIVLTGDGINCEQETAEAFRLAGAQSIHIAHINTVIESPKQLQDAGILALPGGFSFGDEVSSGKVLALKLKYKLGDALRQFVEAKKPIIGICNGFQALVKLGLLPYHDGFQQQITLTHNRQNRFINKWVSLKGRASSPFMTGLDSLMLPIRHGEGRLVVPESLQQVIADKAVLRYEEDVNGSYENIAGLAEGSILGLMPHPEAFVRVTQHPNWQAPPTGLTLFKNMMAMAE
jgi:phosphoribosylformylglycinamidine synthase subunit PurQ / glutaminase